MEPPKISQVDSSLNPLVFPTETEGRFLLLILVVAGVTYSLSEWLLAAFFNNLSDLVITVLSLGPVIIMFSCAWLRAKRIARQEMVKAGWQPIASVENTASGGEPFSFFAANLESTVKALPEVAAERPNFVWDEKDRSVTGRAFGFAKTQYVLVRYGLYEGFVVKYESFQAVLLHELAHIANRDVSKVTFSTQLGKCFYVGSIIMAGLLNLFLIFHAIRRVVNDLTLTPIWDGLTLFAEMNVKLVILFLLVEIIRSSVLRVREHYADSQGVVWLGTTRPFVQQILQGYASNESFQTNGWAKVKTLFRTRFAPYHPAIQERVKAIKDTRMLFEPRRETAVLGGVLAGLALNSNLTLIIIIPNQLLAYGIAYDTVARDNSNILFLLFVLIFGFVLLLIAIGFILIALIFFALIPIVATVGSQIQKAAFADEAQPMRRPLLTLPKLIDIVFFLSLGMVTGFLISPQANALTIGTLTMGSRAILLAPIFVLGWTAIFLFWTVPLRHLAKHLFLAHRLSTPPVKKRRWLTIISILALLPGFFAMVWTQIALSVLIGFTSQFSDAGDKSIVLGSIIVVWIFAVMGYGAIWLGGWFLLKVRGWLPTKYDHSTIPTWAIRPFPAPLPERPDLIMQKSAPPL